MIIYPQIEANQVAGTFKENFIFFFFFQISSLSPNNTRMARYDRKLFGVEEMSP